MLGFIVPFFAWLKRVNVASVLDVKKAKSSSSHHEMFTVSTFNRECCEVSQKIPCSSE
jgi:hypothetical protein